MQQWGTYTKLYNSELHDKLFDLVKQLNLGINFSKVHRVYRIQSSGIDVPSAGVRHIDASKLTGILTLLNGSFGTAFFDNDDKQSGYSICSGYFSFWKGHGDIDQFGAAVDYARFSSNKNPVYRCTHLNTGEVKLHKAVPGTLHATPKAPPEIATARNTYILLFNS